MNSFLGEKCCILQNNIQERQGLASWNNHSINSTWKLNVFEEWKNLKYYKSTDSSAAKTDELSALYLGYKIPQNLFWFPSIISNIFFNFKNWWLFSFSLEPHCYLHFLTKLSFKSMTSPRAFRTIAANRKPDFFFNKLPGISYAMVVSTSKMNKHGRSFFGTCRNELIEFNYSCSQSMRLFFWKPKVKISLI